MTIFQKIARVSTAVVLAVCVTYFLEDIAHFFWSNAGWPWWLVELLLESTEGQFVLWVSFILLSVGTQSPHGVLAIWFISLPIITAILIPLVVVCMIAFLGIQVPIHILKDEKIKF